MKKNFIIAAVLVFAGATAFASAKNNRLSLVWYESTPGSGCTLVQAQECHRVNLENCEEIVFDLNGVPISATPQQIYANPVNATNPILAGCKDPYDRD